MKSKNELRTFYSDVLIPIIAPLENYRIENSILLKRYFFSGIFCLPLLILGFIFMYPFTYILALMPSLILLGLAYHKLNVMNKKLRYPFKYKVLLKCIDYLFNNYEYIANQRIAKSVLLKSQLFPNNIIGVKGEDFMKFKIGDAIIMFCETKVSGPNEKLLFKGVFISSSFNKYFKSKTLVLPNRSSTFFQRLRRKLFDKPQRVNLENPEFERNFIVLSGDQVEARYILTPSLMERILAYKAKTNKRLSISFIDNRLYCAVPNYANLFEVPFFKPIDFDWILRTLEPLILYTDIVEDLNLNLKIWSKQ